MRDAPAYYAQGPEALVVSLAVRGDLDAFTELVRRRQPGVRTLLLGFSGNPELADDLAQEAFLKAWRKIGQLKHPECFGDWIKQIARHEWANHQPKHASHDDKKRHDETPQPSRELSSGSTDIDPAEQDIQRDLFATRVAQSIKRRRKLGIAGRLTTVLLLVALDFLLESPLQQSLGLAAQILGTSLFPIENEWLAFLFAPINSCAGLLGMLLVGIQYLYRKIR